MARKTEETGPNAQVLVGAAKRVRVDERRRADGYRKPETWQSENWEYFDLIGEVKQAAYFLANVVSGIRLFVAELPDDPEQEPMPVAPGTVGAFEANEALDRLRVGSRHGALGGLLAGSVVNLCVTGEYYLLGEPETPPNPDGRTPAERAGADEVWDVKSVDQIEVKGGEAFVKDKPGDKGRPVPLPGPNDPDDAPDKAFLLRVWQRHPRFSDIADCALAACRTECEELLILSRAIRGVARSRIATAGLLFVPSELSFGSPTEAGGDDGEDKFQQELTDAMMAAIKDEDDPKGVVPVLVRGPAEIGQHIKHHTFDRPLDASASTQRSELIGRLGHSLDTPVEQLTGLAGVNHWTAWQIDGASWSRYGQPKARLIVESWTEGYLWPAIEAGGIDPRAARRLVIWFDPADAIVDPDRSKSADEAHDRLTISDEAYRREKQFSEDDAPDDAELERRVRQRTRPPANPGAEQGPPNEGDAPESPDARVHTNGNGQLTAAASRSEPLGRRLMRIDRSLRGQLEEAAEVALRRALERAGARVRSRAQGNSNIAAAISTVPAHLVLSRLNEDIVAALDLSEDELLTGGVDDMAPRFDARVSGAQRRTRAALAAEFDLSEPELEEMERRQDRDRQEGWAWLSGALLSVARDRLYNPSPAAPAAGEFDVSSSVPASILREAMARAGGGLPADGSPPGGVATGNLVLDVWSRHGQVVGGWEWVYGDPSSRTSAFPGHERLDGVQFANWSDSQLLVAPEDDWLGVTHYRPGDHAYCQCDFVPLGTDETTPSEEDQVGELMDAL